MSAILRAAYQIELRDALAPIPGEPAMINFRKRPRRRHDGRARARQARAGLADLIPVIKNIDASHLNNRFL
jgi:hypothetical protein